VCVNAHVLPYDFLPIDVQNIPKTPLNARTCQ
jgi:hypothetical protein